MSPKTEDEIRNLKANWQADPLWNIEETEGFEDYRDELLAFRQKCEEQWAKAAKYRTERSTKYNVDSAVDMILIANRDPGVWSAQDMLVLSVAHSLLALVSELKRANDLKEEK